jgi:cation diffusion facilitator family transporter
MRTRPPIDLPQKVQADFRRATRIQWFSLTFMVSCVFVIYFTLGQSQAMKAIFIEDLMAIIPAAAYLIADRIRWRAPDQRFPYGRMRVVAVGFLGSAIAIVALGVIICFEALKTLLTREHPSIGVVSLFGHELWLGYLMLPALLYTIAGEFTFGRIKLPYGERLHDKTLLADARMNRADWMSGSAAIAGVIDIAFGLWWADACAALFIGIEIVRDGFSNMKDVARELLDEVPKEEPWAEKLRDRVLRLPWVIEAEVRIREEGNLLTGEVFVTPRTPEDLLTRGEEVQQLARELDWRFWELTLTAKR